MSSLNVCIVGGTGFVGRSIANGLVRQGHQVRVLCRRRERNKDMLVLPGLILSEGDVHELGFLRTECQNMDVVINLVGVLNESGGKQRSFDAIHVDLPRKIIEACRQVNVPRLLHMSALHASRDGGSDYLRSKFKGESLALNAADDSFHVTSFRPSVIFGPGDSFTNRFANLLRGIPYFFPLACPDARFQPIYVDDVATAFITSINRHQCFGKHYELCGPKTYSLYELVEYIAELINVKRKIVRLADWQARLQARLLEFVPGKPFTRDNYRSLQIDSVCNSDFPSVFGISPATLEDVAPTYLSPRRDHLSRFRRLARRS